MSSLINYLFDEGCLFDGSKKNSTHFPSFYNSN